MALLWDDMNLLINLKDFMNENNSILDNKEVGSSPKKIFKKIKK